MGRRFRPSIGWSVGLSGGNSCWAIHHVGMLSLVPCARGFRLKLTSWSFAVDVGAFADPRFAAFVIFAIPSFGDSQFASRSNFSTLASSRIRWREETDDDADNHDEDGDGCSSR